MAQCCTTRLSVVLWIIMILFGCLVVFVALGVVNSSPQRRPAERTDPSKEVLLLNVLFRHGARTPADTYPNDPHVNETFSPYGWGHLTNDGKRELFETGQWLRTRYGNYLGDTYHPDAVWAQTTGVTRTKMSMQLVLAGLFPPRGTQLEWSRRLNWQPIPIFSEPLEDDSLLLVRTPCPRYYEAVDEVFDRPEVRAELDKNRELFEELTELTGMSIKTPDDIQSLYSTLKAETEFGLRLPPWTRKFYPEKLQNLTELSYIYNIYTDEIKQLKAGPFIQKLLTEFENKNDDTIKPKDLKISLYTGHDSSVVNILSGLNVWPKQFPTYGIMALFELVRDKRTGQTGVQMYLRNNPSNPPTPLTMPGCEHFCPLDKFVALASQSIPKERSTACLARSAGYVAPAPGGP